MKRIYILLTMAALLTACGHRVSKTDGNKSERADTSEVATLTEVPAFQTDSIGLEHEDSMTTVTICVDWPVAGNKALTDSIRQYICEELATLPYEESETEAKLFDDGAKAVEAAIAMQHKALADSWREAKEAGIPHDMAYSYYLHVFKGDEGKNYITYHSNNEGFTGGAHGFASSEGITFRKSDGRRIGYRRHINLEKECDDLLDQTLFSQPESPQLAALLKEGVRSYFKQFDEETALDDEQLKEALIGVDDVNRIPLPSTPPVFTKEGLSFIYQQYEIAPYAAGMPNFVIPYDKVRPFLTKDAQSLTE